MKSFKDMTYEELLQWRELYEIRKDNCKEKSSEWIKADLGIKAIDSELDRRSNNDTKTII